jgi:hypothetical protein
MNIMRSSKFGKIMEIPRPKVGRMEIADIECYVL